MANFAEGLADLKNGNMVIENEMCSKLEPFQATANGTCLMATLSNAHQDDARSNLDLEQAEINPVIPCKKIAKTLNNMIGIFTKSVM